jgi:hypothetical protein
VNSVALAQIFVTVIGLYLMAGLIFAAAFIMWGAGKIDPAAREATLGFRLIIIPGVILLWPLLAQRWRRGAVSPRVERHAHREIYNA